MSNPTIRYAKIAGEEVFDEFIAHNATIHLEAMGNASWWIGVEIDGRMWHINIGAHNDRVKSYAVCEEI